MVFPGDFHIPLGPEKDPLTTMWASSQIWKKKAA
jgi:hypothetical protein